MTEMRDKRKGLLAGYKKSGPTLRFTIQVAVASIFFTVIFFLIQIWSAPTKKDTSDIRMEHVDRKTEHSTIQKSLNSLELSNNSINQKLKTIDKYLREKELSLQGQLKSQFPLAYALYYISGDEYTFLSRNPLLDVKWNSAEIIEFSSHTIKVRMPNWQDRLNRNLFSGTLVAIPRIEGFVAKPSGSYPIISTVKYLTDRSEGAVIIIGYSRVDDRKRTHFPN